MNKRFVVGRLVFYGFLLAPVYHILGNQAAAMLFAGFLIGEALGHLTRYRRGKL